MATDVLAVDRDELLRQLDGVNTRDFHRPAVPAVFAEYEAFIATGQYPYIDSVVTVIALKYEVSVENWGPRQQQFHDFHHQALCDLGDRMLLNLKHEVFLASGQHRVGEMEAKEQALVEQGYRPITELVPAAGMRVELPDGVVYRLVQADGRVFDNEGVSRWQAMGDWALLAPRKRTNGVSLNGLVAQHRAYEKAKADRQDHNDSPVVRMFKAAEGSP